jgi:hypothetical protein
VARAVRSRCEPARASAVAPPPHVGHVRLLLPTRRGPSLVLVRQLDIPVYVLRPRAEVPFALEGKDDDLRLLNGVAGSRVHDAWTRRTPCSHAAATPRSEREGRSGSFPFVRRSCEDPATRPFGRLPVHDSLPLVWAQRTSGFSLRSSEGEGADAHRSAEEAPESAGLPLPRGTVGSDAIRRPDRPRETSPVRAAHPFGTIARSARSLRVRRPSHPGGRSRRSDSPSPHHRVSSPRRRSR